ncbi:ATP synthase F1 subunit gamma [soil metagenome]
MKQPREVAAERDSMGTIVGLTGVFEGLASMRIAQTKNQVLESQKFFDELWQIYTRIRVDDLFRFGRNKEKVAIDKILFIIITAEGGFSGDIDQRLIREMLKEYSPETHEIIVIGHHGAIQLSQRGVSYEKYYKLPVRDQNINVRPLIQHISEHKSTVVFYQSYESLMVQNIKRIELQNAVSDAGQRNAKSEQADDDDDTISDATYIFEPSTYEVVAHLERSMLQISLSQLILGSKLAQYASRFRSMSAAKQRGEETFHSLSVQYNRTKRAVSDERLKEIINGLRGKQAV